MVEKPNVREKATLQCCDVKRGSVFVSSTQADITSVMKNFPGKQHAGEGLSELPKASTSSARRFSGRYVWTIVFSLLQLKKLEKCAALHQQDSGQG